MFNLGPFSGKAFGRGFYTAIRTLRAYLHATWLSSLALVKGDTPVTFSTEMTLGEHTVIDHEGTVRTCIANEARFPGARRVRNILDAPVNFGDPKWLVWRASKIGATVIDGVACEEINFQAFNDSALYQYPTIKIYTYGRYAVRCKVRAKTGTVTLRLSIGGSASNFTPDITVGTEWTDIGHYITAPFAGADNISLRNGSAAASQDFYIANFQNEDVTLQSNKNPGNFTTTTEAFNTLNGNTLSNTTYGVLTEAVGAVISPEPEGLLLEPSRTNPLYHVNDFTQTSWVKGGTATASIDATKLAPNGLQASLLSGLQASGGNNISQAATYTSGATFSPDFWLALKTDALGAGERLRFLNPQGTTYGVWYVNPDDLTPGTWYRINKYSPHVTIAVPFAANGVNGGINFSTDVGTGTADIWVAEVNVQEGKFPTSSVPSGGSKLTRDVTTMSLPVSNIDPNVGTLVFDFTPSFDSADITVNSSIMTLEGDSGTTLLYVNSAGLFRSFDGTQTPDLPEPTISIVAGTEYHVKLRWDSATGNHELDVNGNSSAVTNFTGFATTGDLEFNLGGLAFSIKNFKIYKEYVSDGKWSAL